jgi:hypothetical protein
VILSNRNYLAIKKAHLLAPLTIALDLCKQRLMEHYFLMKSPPLQPIPKQSYLECFKSDLVVGGDGYLQLIKHKVSNQVTVKNGEFILLGGMMQQSSGKHS